MSHPSSLSFALAFGALVVGALAMGISPVFVRYAEIGPFSSAFWRVGLALPLLFIWMAIENRKAQNNTSTALTPRSVFTFDWPIVLSGLFFFGDLFFWHLAILNTTIANATLMACLAPLWVIVFSKAFIGESVKKTAYIALILCIIGAAFLISSNYSLNPAGLIGDLYGVITSIFFGAYFLSIRVARRSHGAGATTFKSTLITALLLFVVALCFESNLWPYSVSGIAALFALGFISHSAGQGLLTIALGSLSAAFSSLVIFIEALAAALFGWLIFSENLTLLQTIGAVLILSGIWIARPKSAPTKAKPKPNR